VTDPWTPRPYRVPLNVPIGAREGQAESIPLVGILGFLGISSILVMVVLTHAIGRVAGPAWIAVGLIIYWTYRRRSGLPLAHSVHRDWDKEQLQVYHDAGEIEILEEFAENLERRNRLHATLPAGANGAPSGGRA
jgi:APA family basic amino acid/polyamine antiporter